MTIDIDKSNMCVSIVNIGVATICCFTGAAG